MRKSSRPRAIIGDVIDRIAESHRAVLARFKAIAPTPKADLHQWALDAAHRYRATHRTAFRETKKRRAVNLMEDVYLPLVGSARALRDEAALRRAAATSTWDDALVYRLLTFCGGRGAVLQDVFVGSPDRAAKAKGAATKRRAYSDLVRPLLSKVLQIWNQERTPNPSRVAAKVIDGLSNAELDRLAGERARHEDHRETIRVSQTKKLATVLGRIDMTKTARLLQRLDVATSPNRQRAVADHGFRGEVDYYTERLLRLLLGATAIGNDESPTIRERDKQRFEDAEPFMASLIEETDRAMAARLRSIRVPSAHQRLD